MPYAARRQSTLNTAPATTKTFIRRLPIILLIAIAPFAVGVLALTVFSNYPSPYTGSRFDSKQWIDAGFHQHFEPNKRSPMARDLLDNHLPRGMTESQVRSLLGEPEEDVKDRHFSSRTLGTHEYQYEVGSWSAHGWDDAFVVVDFNGQGKLISAELGGY